MALNNDEIAALNAIGLSNNCMKTCGLDEGQLRAISSGKNVTELIQYLLRSLTRMNKDIMLLIPILDALEHSWEFPEPDMKERWNKASDIIKTNKAVLSEYLSRCEESSEFLEHKDLPHFLEQILLSRKQ